MEALDLVLVGGTIYDGTGAPPFARTLGVRGGRLQLFDPQLPTPPAAIVLDVEGLAVSPGFIDVHSHTDFQPFVDGLSTSKAHDGVTLEISGNCGFSAVPFDDHTRRTENERFSRHGVTLDWDDMTGYREALQEKGVGIHHGMLVGHGNLRSEVMGYEDREPTARELDRMKGILGELLDQGALGISSGLIYPPGCFSKTGELIELARVAGEKGKIYTSHIRGEGRSLESAIDEVLTIARESGSRVQISHLKASGRDNWYKLEGVLEKIRAVREAGFPVMADRYPYTATNTYLYTLFRNWVYEGGIEAQLTRLADVATRARILEEMRQDYPDSYFEKILVSSTGPISSRFTVPGDSGESVAGKNLAEIAAGWGLEPHEAVVALFRRHDGAVFGIFFNLSEENLERVLGLEYCMVASDGSAQVVEGDRFEEMPHPRAYGTFTRALGRYGRDAGWFPLETAIAKMTSMPARHFGLVDRGVIADSAHADLVVFDPATVLDASTYARPHQLSTGVKHLIVAGELVLQDGIDTGARPGRVL